MADGVIAAPAARAPRRRNAAAPVFDRLATESPIQGVSGGSTLTAVCRLVMTTVWLAATSPTELSSLIGDKR